MQSQILTFAHPYSDLQLFQKKQNWQPKKKDNINKQLEQKLKQNYNILQKFEQLEKQKNQVQQPVQKDKSRDENDYTNKEIFIQSQENEKLSPRKEDNVEIVEKQEYLKIINLRWPVLKELNDRDFDQQITQLLQQSISGKSKQEDSCEIIPNEEKKDEKLKISLIKPGFISTCQKNLDKMVSRIQNTSVLYIVNSKSSKIVSSSNERELLKHAYEVKKLSKSPQECHKELITKMIKDCQVVYSTTHSLLLDMQNEDLKQLIQESLKHLRTDVFGSQEIITTFNEQEDFKFQELQRSKIVTDASEIQQYRIASQRLINQSQIEKQFESIIEEERQIMMKQKQERVNRPNIRQLMPMQRPRKIFISHTEDQIRINKSIEEKIENVKSQYFVRMIGLSAILICEFKIIWTHDGSQRVQINIYQLKNLKQKLDGSFNFEFDLDNLLRDKRHGRENELDELIRLRQGINFCQRAYDFYIDQIHKTMSWELMDTVLQFYGVDQVYDSRNHIESQGIKIEFDNLKIDDTQMFSKKLISILKSRDFAFTQSNQRLLKYQDDNKLIILNPLIGHSSKLRRQKSPIRCIDGLNTKISSVFNIDAFIVYKNHRNDEDNISFSRLKYSLQKAFDLCKKFYLKENIWIDFFKNEDQQIPSDCQKIRLMLSNSSKINLERVDKRYGKLLSNNFNQESYSYLGLRLSNHQNIGRYIFDNESMGSKNMLKEMLVYDKRKRDTMLFVQFQIKDHKLSILIYQRDNIDEKAIIDDKELINEVVNILMHNLWKGIKQE